MYLRVLQTFVDSWSSMKCCISLKGDQNSLGRGLNEPLPIIFFKLRFRIGKILERLSLSGFFPHISKSLSFSPLQSAYRKFHSTETDLLKLTNDILESIDSGKITILTALDMSAAFDTLDHITLLHRLQHTFGLSG